jgi:DNA-binding transcriptional LysR family regulator
MDLATLRVFVEVARRGGFAPVARDFDLDPSAVSRTVAALEDELGLRLFQRTTRRVALTEAGERYFAHVLPILEALERARDEAHEVSDEATGTLRMTASVGFGQACLVPLLGAFRARHPKLTVELLLTDANLDLVRERIDLAIRLGPQVDADFVGQRLFETRYRVCASPDYVRRRGLPASPEALSGHDCLRFALPDFRTRWRFRAEREGREQHGRADGDAGDVLEVPVHGSLMISSSLALRQCAIDGLGPALLADWLIGDDIAAGRLIDLCPRHRVTATDFDTGAWLLYPSRHYVPAKTRAMIAMLRERWP